MSLSDIPEGSRDDEALDALVENTGEELLEDKTSGQQNPLLFWAKLQVSKLEPENPAAHWAMGLQVQDCLFSLCELMRVSESNR